MGIGAIGKSGGLTFVGILMVIIGIGFGLAGAADFYMLVRVSTHVLRAWGWLCLSLGPSSFPTLIDGFYFSDLTRWLNQIYPHRFYNRVFEAYGGHYGCPKSHMG